MNGWKFDGVTLRLLRQEAQMTAADMAAAIGCHLHSIHRFERGEQPSAKYAWALINALSEKLGRHIGLDDVASQTQLGRTPHHSRRAS